MKCVINTFFLFAIYAAQAQSPVVPFLMKETNHLQNIRDCALSPDGNEFYFTHQKADFSYSVIYQMKRKNGTWTKPVKLSFCKKYRYLEPAFSPNGLRLYFVSDQPHGDTETTDFDIWYLEREDVDLSWSEPIHPQASFNSEFDEFYPSVTEKGDLYFTSERTGTKGKDDIFCARFQNGIYEQAISLSDSINSDGTEYNAWVSPDATVLIFGAYKRPDGLGSGDLYISFAKSTGEWRQAINLGSIINSDKMDYCPFIDVKDKVLYFTSRRPVETMPYAKAYQREQAKFPGGRSRLFCVPLNEISWLKNFIMNEQN